ncbi:unnamed protein product [Arctia plantaginis]|uniref:Uncharacterized protein n=1 Tax=Arctia plantaginis TaxID=874455 RepID=A0A8S0YWI6_ARCPL|nr:unnamed protein product [Arctia plantaginis]CAB3247511.1 unnamed protein product [Arctia plantaginis]
MDTHLITDECPRAKDTGLRSLSFGAVSEGMGRIMALENVHVRLLLFTVAMLLVRASEAWKEGNYRENYAFIVSGTELKF